MKAFQPFVLYHRGSHIESAAIRKMIQDLGLKAEFEFRDVDENPEAAADFAAQGGNEVPAIWTGKQFISGRREIEESLRWAVEEPFPELLDRFDEIAHSTWDDVKKLIPEELRQKLDQIQFWIYDEPTDDILADLPPEIAEEPEELCGLHVGTPMTQASLSQPDIDPVRVYLFRWAHLDLLDPKDEDPEKVLRQEIAITLLHEIGHYFGLGEDDLERLGYD